MQNLIARGEAQQGEGVLVRCQIGKEAKDVLCVQFAADECTRDVDSTLDVLGEKGGVDGFSLW